MSDKFYVLNSKGQRITGLADYQKNKSPAIIICHGFKGGKEEPLLEELAKKLFQRGFSAFRFDFGNGMGESYGRMEDITVTQELGDLKAVADFVYNNPNVIKAGIGLAGRSLGGMLAILYAAMDARIRAVSPLAPVLRLDITPAINQGLPFMLKWKKQGFQIFHSYSRNIDVSVKYSFYDDGKRYDSSEAARNLKIPVFLVHGSRDEAVPAEHSKMLYSIAKEPKKLLIVKNSDHSFTKKEHLDEVTDKVAEWFRTVLT